MLETKRTLRYFKNGDLVEVKAKRKNSNTGEYEPFVGLAVVVDAQNLLQIATIKMQATQEVLKRVQYRFLEPKS